MARQALFKSYCWLSAEWNRDIKHPLLVLTYADASIRPGLFTEARKLLTDLAGKDQATFTPTTLDFILNLAGPHPLFLQIAGFHAFELRQIGQRNRSDRSRLLGYEYKIELLRLWVERYKALGRVVEDVG